MLSRDRKERGHQAWALRLLGEIALHRHPPEVAPAEAFYRQALALAEGWACARSRPTAITGSACCMPQTGQREQARAALSTAIEMYQAMDMTFWLPQAEAALAQVEGR